jgi:hypothetical protein
VSFERDASALESLSHAHVAIVLAEGCSLRDADELSNHRRIGDLLSSAPQRSIDVF